VTHPPPAPAVPNSVPSSFLANNKSKSKKKKHIQPTVTMATASPAAAGASGVLGENTGRWTAEEHRLFLQGLDQHGKGWKKIASLIKSRTVVQIRTHAQKYFQKLAKARQNGEEGDVAMEGRGGVASIPMSPTLQSTKRRRQTGTKRKAISSVVASSHRQGKRLAAARASAGAPSSSPPLPAVAPALAPFVPPSIIPSITTLNGTISLPALEDSLYDTVFATVLCHSFLRLSYPCCFSLLLL
jgi:SHAQKYF class myb-like DNA-binding protein